MNIIEYNDNLHRTQLIKLWEEVFGYTDKRNKPSLVIDKKNNEKDNLLLVAVNANIIIGSIMAGYDGHRGWIYALAVDKRHRGKYLGRNLLEAAERKLTDLGCLKINLQVLPSNSGVVEFYKKNGYKTEERISLGKVIHSNMKF